MQEFGNGFVPRYADYALMIDCTEEALDNYGKWLGAQVMTWKPSESIEDILDLLAEVREVLGARNRISGIGLGEDWYGIRMDALPLQDPGGPRSSTVPGRGLTFRCKQRKTGTKKEYKNGKR